MKIQLKLLLLLVTLPVVCLSLYLVLVVDLFEQDKIAYVFDSSSSVSKIIASQVKTKLTATIDDIKPIIKGYSNKTRKFNDRARTAFKEFKSLKAIFLLSRKGNLRSKLQKGPGNLNRLVIENTKRDGISLSIENEIKGIFWIGIDLGKKQNLIVVAKYTAMDLASIFQKSSVYKNILVSANGEEVVGNKALKDYNVTEWSFFKKLKNNKRDSGVLEFKSPKDNDWLISFAKVGVGKIYSVSLVKKSKAMLAVLILLKKSILFFISLISAAIMISLVVSKSATASLKQLASAANEISQGNFDVRVDVKSNDEIADLTRGMNHMATEIVDLMLKNIEKTRMEAELKTAQAVQEQLFPDPIFKRDEMELCGHYQSSSECGGDWWNVNEVGDDIFLWIGDATGHGAGAALVTSAAKAVSTMISHVDGVTPDQAMEYMNKSICETTKGKICMTFFVAAYNRKNGTLTYSNSGHDAPFLFEKEEKLTKKSIIPLIEANGPRLGDSFNSKYESHTITIKKGTTIFFYTDGIVELENAEGQLWSERAMIKEITKSANNGLDIFDTSENLKKAIDNFRKETPLKDDVTFFFTHFLQDPPPIEIGPKVPRNYNSGIFLSLSQKGTQA